MDKTVSKALEVLNKKFGEGTLIRIGDEVIADVESVPTGIRCIDEALGVGGLPKGRITEIFGSQSSGKTTCCLHAIAQSQKNGELTAIIDTENALDLAYAKSLGVDVENLFLAQPSSGEVALQTLEVLLETKKFGIVVIDSVATLTPQSELNGEIGDAHVGSLARLMSSALRRLNPKIRESNTAVVFTNQVRSNIGMYVAPETTPGGRALPFYASIRIKVSQSTVIKAGEEAIGNRIKFKTVKNKVAPPNKQIEYDIIYGKGISTTGDLMDRAFKAKVFIQKGSWISYNEETICQGKEALRELLDDTPEFAEKIELDIQNTLA